MSETQYIRDIVAVTLSLPIVYIGMLGTLRAISRTFSKTLKNQQELDVIVIEEAEKLGIQHPVSAELVSVFTTSRAYPEQQHIVIGASPKRATVRHELYHIYRQDAYRNPFHTMFVSETRAIIYELFGIK